MPGYEIVQCNDFILFLSVRYYTLLLLRVTFQTITNLGNYNKLLILISKLRTYLILRYCINYADVFCVSKINIDESWWSMVLHHYTCDEFFLSTILIHMKSVREQRWGSCLWWMIFTKTLTGTTASLLIDLEQMRNKDSKKMPAKFPYMKLINSLTTLLKVVCLLPAAMYCIWTLRNAKWLLGTRFVLIWKLENALHWKNA